MTPRPEHEHDLDLLSNWTQTRSEAAFRLLVARYAPLVWGVALRKTRDHSYAEETVQQVFSDLAQKASVLVALGRPLAPWLHRAAVFESVQVLRCRASVSIDHSLIRQLASRILQNRPRAPIPVFATTKFHQSITLDLSTEATSRPPRPFP